MNTLPKYWVVLNDGSQLFKDTVIKYLNETYDTGWGGDLTNIYYGYDGNNYFMGTSSHKIISLFENKPTILTLKQFITMTQEFKRGELIEVSDYKDYRDGQKRIFLTHIEGAIYPFICIANGHEDKFKSGEKFGISECKYARKIQDKPQGEIELTVKVNGKEVPLSDISEETLLKIRNKQL